MEGTVRGKCNMPMSAVCPQTHRDDLFYQKDLFSWLCFFTFCNIAFSLTQESTLLPHKKENPLLDSFTLMGRGTWRTSRPRHFQVVTWSLGCVGLIETQVPMTIANRWWVLGIKNCLFCSSSLSAGMDRPPAMTFDCLLCFRKTNQMCLGP